MATTTLQAGTRTALTTSALDLLNSATYIVAGTIDVSALDPVDYLVEVTVTPGTVATPKQVAVFAKISTDTVSTNFTSGPETGTGTTDESNLYLLGVIPCNSNATPQTKTFSIFSALGFVPPFCKIIVKNETGAQLAASGHSVYVTPITAITA